MTHNLNKIIYNIIAERFVLQFAWFPTRPWVWSLEPTKWDAERESLLETSPPLMFDVRETITTEAFATCDYIQSLNEHEYAPILLDILSLGKQTCNFNLSKEQKYDFISTNVKLYMYIKSLLIILLLFN